MRVQFFSASLLGRHIANRSQSASGTCQMVGVYLLCGQCFRIGSWVLCGTYLRQTKIQNFGVAALSDEYVRRLDVSMDDAFRVRRIQSVSDFYG